LLLLMHKINSNMRGGLMLMLDVLGVPIILFFLLLSFNFLFGLDILLLWFDTLGSEEEEDEKKKQKS
jgi:hypothetical protein